MTVYNTESEVIVAIESKLLGADCKSKVTPYSDIQGKNTVERVVVFKASVALKDSETIINNTADIGTDTDRSIRYKGSQVEPTEQGEMRYLFFEANINPYEEY